MAGSGGRGETPTVEGGGLNTITLEYTGEPQPRAVPIPNAPVVPPVSQTLPHLPLRSLEVFIGGPLDRCRRVVNSATDRYAYPDPVDPIHHVYVRTPYGFEYRDVWAG